MVPPLQLRPETGCYPRQVNSPDRRLGSDWSRSSSSVLTLHYTDREGDGCGNHVDVERSSYTVISLILISDMGGMRSEKHPVKETNESQ